MPGGGNSGLAKQNTEREQTTKRRTEFGRGGAFFGRRFWFVFVCPEQRPEPAAGQEGGLAARRKETKGQRGNTAVLPGII